MLQSGRSGMRHVLNVMSHIKLDYTRPGGGLIKFHSSKQGGGDPPTLNTYIVVALQRCLVRAQLTLVLWPEVYEASEPSSQLFFKAINKLGWEREQVVWEEKNNKSELENFCQTVAWVKKSAYQWSSASISGNLLLSPFPPKKFRDTSEKQQWAKHCVLLVGILHFACSFRSEERKKKKTHKNTDIRTRTQCFSSFTPTINLTHLREASKIPCFWTMNFWMEKGRMMKFWKGSYELIFLLVEQIGNMILSLVFFVFLDAKFNQESWEAPGAVLCLEKMRKCSPVLINRLLLQHPCYNYSQTHCCFPTKLSP